VLYQLSYSRNSPSERKPKHPLLPTARRPLPTT